MFQMWVNLRVVIADGGNVLREWHDQHAAVDGRAPCVAVADVWLPMKLGQVGNFEKIDLEHNDKLLNISLVLKALMYFPVQPE